MSHVRFPANDMLLAALIPARRLLKDRWLNCTYQVFNCEQLPENPTSSLFQTPGWWNLATVAKVRKRRAQKTAGILKFEVADRARGETTVGFLSQTSAKLTSF